MYGNKSRFSLLKMQFCKHLVDVILRDSIWLSGTCTLVSDVSHCHEQDNALCSVLYARTCAIRFEIVTDVFNVVILFWCMPWGIVGD